MSQPSSNTVVDDSVRVLRGIHLLQKNATQSVVIYLSWFLLILTNTIIPIVVAGVSTSRL